MLAAMILAAAAAPVCPPEAPSLIAGRQAVRPRPLTAEPPAQAYFAVRRLENGCAKPQLVSQRRANRR